jgi:hypothetical protein
MIIYSSSNEAWDQLGKAGLRGLKKLENSRRTLDEGGRMKQCGHPLKDGTRPWIDWCWNDRRMVTKVCPVHRFESHDLTGPGAQAYLQCAWHDFCQTRVYCTPALKTLSDALKKRHYFSCVVEPSSINPSLLMSLIYVALFGVLAGAASSLGSWRIPLVPFPC